MVVVPHSKKVSTLDVSLKWISWNHGPNPADGQHMPGRKEPNYSQVVKSCSCERKVVWLMQSCLSLLVFAGL